MTTRGKIGLDLSYLAARLRKESIEISIKIGELNEDGAESASASEQYIKFTDAKIEKLDRIQRRIDGAIDLLHDYLGGA